jgi:hypothetical protein
MKIIDRLPLADGTHLISVRGEVVDVYRNQIILWTSIDDMLRPLPANLESPLSDGTQSAGIAAKHLHAGSPHGLDRLGDRVRHDTDVRSGVEPASDRNRPGLVADLATSTWAQSELLSLARRDAKRKWQRSAQR